MSLGAPAAADVPGIFDIIIDGKGYVFANTLDQSLPFRVQRASYTFSPTFVERQNVQGDYGDDQQAFWQTFTQRDWSLGEQQKFFRSNDEEKRRRYWQGSNVDVRTAGQVTLRQLTSSLSFSEAAVSCAGKSTQSATTNTVFAASASNLYEVDASGTVTSHGAHGLGTTPSRFGLCTDGQYAYISAGGAGKIRYWNGAAYADFAASTDADSLCYLNNTLYGFRNSTADLVRWDTAGALTSLFPWKRGQGTAQDFRARLKAFGGQLAILINRGVEGPELWIYNGVAPAMVYQMPPNFYAHDIDVAFGVIFVGGAYVKSSAGSNSNVLARPAILYYASGSTGELWKADDYFSTTYTNLETGPYTSIAPYDAGLVFNDDSRGVINYYDIGVGGIHTIGSYTVAGTVPLLAGSQRFFLHTRTQTTGYYHPDTNAVAASGYVATSLDDYESSLLKAFRGITIDATIPTGSSIDIAYQVDSVSGAYTSLVTGATSGTENLLTGVTGHSISVKVTLNKGSSAAGPTLKRIYVRAVPVLSSYRMDEVILNLSGSNGKTHVVCRNDKSHPLDGQAQALNLRATAVAQAPVSVTDRFGTFTAVIEPDKTELIEVAPEEYIARVLLRQV